MLFYKLSSNSYYISQRKILITNSTATSCFAKEMPLCLKILGAFYGDITLIAVTVSIRAAENFTK